MNNITVFEHVDSLTNEITEYVWIDRGNGEFTSMTKAHYDELEAAKENGTIS